MRARNRLVLHGALLAGLALGTTTVQAQVAIRPHIVTPGASERFTVEVINPLDSPFVAIRVEVPPAFEVLGVQPRPEWPFDLDAIPGGGQAIEWRGGWVANGEFQEFVFLARVRTDIDGTQVAVPVHLTRVGGAVESWIGSGVNPAPRVALHRAPEFTATGTTMLGVIAIVVSFVALVLAIAARFAQRPRSD